MKRQISLLVLTASIAFAAPALAQGSSFFGGGSGLTPPGAVGGLETEGDNGAGGSSAPKSSGGATPGIAQGGGQGGDYTSDEKRMQRKFKDNLKHAKSLIEKGEGLMKAAGGNTSHKDYKKGKILKETGEKYLSDLQSNNPFPEPVKATNNKAGGKQEL